MASQPITGSVSAFPATPPMPAVARILARFKRDQLAGFIAVAIDLLDTIDGDPEAEEIPVEDAQLTYDLPPEEDPTDCDLENGTDVEDDFTLSRQALGYDKGPGCGVSDTGERDDEDTGIEDDPRGCDPEEDMGTEEAGEVEQMVQDVPTVACYAIEPADDGRRPFLGYWNPGSFIGHHPS